MKRNVVRRLTRTQRPSPPVNALEDPESGGLAILHEPLVDFGACPWCRAAVVLIGAGVTTPTHARRHAARSALHALGYLYPGDTSRNYLAAGRAHDCRTPKRKKSRAKKKPAGGDTMLPPGR